MISSLAAATASGSGWACAAAPPGHIRLNAINAAIRDFSIYFSSVTTGECLAAISGSADGHDLTSLVDELRCCLNWGRSRCRRNRKCEPCVPATGSVRRIELFVSLKVQIALHVSNGKQVSDLRTEGGDVRFEITQDRQLTGVRGDLLIGVAN